MLQDVLRRLFFTLGLFWSTQREEEQARERAKAEQIRQERELLAAKEEEARQVRKKVMTNNTCGGNVTLYAHCAGRRRFTKHVFLFQRLEEIMRRTRRTDSPDMVKLLFSF